MAHMAALSRNIFFLSKILLGFTQGLIQSLLQWLSAVQWEQPQPGYSLLAAAVPCSGNPFLCSLRNMDHNPQIVVSGQISKGYRITEIMNGSNRFTRGRLAKPGSHSGGTSNATPDTARGRRCPLAVLRTGCLSIFWGL